MQFISSLSCIPFFALAATCIVCSLGMIFNKNLVRSGFLLIGSFSAIAGLYFMLSASFVAISQILIYAVGITLVVVFAIMLCSLRQVASDVVDDETSKEYQGRRVIGLLVSLGLFAIMFFVIQSQNWNLISEVAGANAVRDSIEEISSGYTALIGNHMMSNYLAPFELVSVLLLIILVGVIILSKKVLENK